MVGRPSALGATSDTRETPIEAAPELFVFRGCGDTGSDQIARGAAGRSWAPSTNSSRPRETRCPRTLNRRKGRPTRECIDDPIERIFGLLAAVQHGDRVDCVEDGSFSSADGDRGRRKRIRANKDIKRAWERADLASGWSVEVLLETPA